MGWEDRRDKAEKGGRMSKKIQGRETGKSAEERKMKKIKMKKKKKRMLSEIRAVQLGQWT